jgi:hypothetical protein
VTVISYEPRVVPAVAVSVAVCGFVSVMETEVGERLHDVGLAALAGPVTAHVRLTVPVKEFDGVTVMVEVPLELGATLILPLLLRE